MAPRRYGIGLVLVLVGLLLGGPAWAQDARRVALVIGNSRYEHVGRLANPGNDAAAMAAALRRIGFEVVEVRTDLGAGPMRQALQAFAGTARGADTALVFYAGHSIEVDGQNYLVPIDAKLATDTDVRFEAVPLDLVLDAVEAAAQLRLVILDACRNNPFKARMVLTRPGTRGIGRGLGEIDPGSTLVAYAAKHGQEALDGRGRNSPFTTALLAHLETPGLDVGFLFRKVRADVLAATSSKQEPFTYGSLGPEEHYLVPPRIVPNPEPAPAFDARQLDLAFWQAIQASRNPADFEEYLRQFPNGLFVGIARNRLEELRPKPSDTRPYLSKPSQQSRAERCCVYRLGWCKPWALGPGKYAPQVMDAELNSVCYCPGDQQGLVGQDCR